MTEGDEGTGTMPPTNIKNGHRKHWLILLTAIFLVAGIAYSIYWFVIGQFSETTNDAYVNGNLVKIMPRVSGYVTQIMTDETDLVKKNQPIVMLDSTDAQINLKSAEVKLALTVRRVKQFYENVKRLQNVVIQKKENLEKVKEDYQRRKGLIVNKEISAEELRHAEIAVATQTAALKVSQQQLASAITLVANSDLYHHPQVQAAAQIVRDAYLALKRTTIYSPVTGYVATRPIQVGQQVNLNSTLMVIIPLNEIWVDANFKEAQLRNIRIGQPATCISDIYGRHIKYRGTVIGLNPGAGNTLDLLPPQNATGNWIKIVQRLPVRIVLDPKQVEENPLQIGLSMTVSVNTHQRGGHVLPAVPNKKTLYQAEDQVRLIKEADDLIGKILNENAQNISYPEKE